MLMMSKLSNLSDMKISTDIPDDWVPKLKVAAAKAGSRSVADFLRAYIQETIGETPVNKPWGGSRQAKQDAQPAQDEQDEDVAQVEEDAQDEEPPVVKSFQAVKPTGALTPAQIIAQRKAAYAEKHPLPKPVNGKKTN